MPKTKAKKSGQHFRGKAGSQFRAKGSPEKIDQQVGKKWRLDLLEDNRFTKTTNRLNTYVESDHVLAQKKLNLYKSLLQQRENDILSLERKESLRVQADREDVRTNHYIPGDCKKGRPLCLESLKCVASICASGSQYSKV
jgi:hypothetical protein